MGVVTREGAGSEGATCGWSTWGGGVRPPELGGGLRGGCLGGVPSVLGSRKFSLALEQAVRGNPRTPNCKMGIPRLWGAGIPPLFWCHSSGGFPGSAAPEVGPTVPNSVTPFGGGSVRGDGDKLALARGICASGTVCGGRHMAVVIPCVPDITIHVSQPGVVSRCCCPCPVSWVTTTVTATRSHACFSPMLLPTFGGPHTAPQSCSGDVSPHLRGCTGSIPVPWEAPLGAPQCRGGLCHGGLRRGTVPAAVGREPGCAAGTEPGTAGVTPVTS